MAADYVMCAANYQPQIWRELLQHVQNATVWGQFRTNSTDLMQVLGGGVICTKTCLESVDASQQRLMF